MVDRVVVTEGSGFGVCSQAPWRYSITVPRQLTKDEQVILATFAGYIVRCEPIETQSGTNGVQKAIDLIEIVRAEVDPDIGGLSENDCPVVAAILDDAIGLLRREVSGDI